MTGVVRRKSTTELLRDLKKTKQIDSFLDRNGEDLQNTRFAEEFRTVCYNQKLKKAELARRCCVSEVYFHQILSGNRTPSRNRLLCMCLGMELGAETTTQLLRACGYSELYPRDHRDAIILHGILHHTSVQEVNENLFENREELILS